LTFELFNFDFLIWTSFVHSVYEKIILPFSVLVLSLQASAQFTVRLIVTDVATRKNDDVYVAGNFNNWNPKDENYKLKPFGGSRKSIVIKDLPAGSYAFKFTSGGGDKWETTSDGRDIADRLIEVNEDLSKEFTVAGWKDDYPEVPKKYTASPQVRIIDTAFNMPQLGRKRKVWIYLPKGYAALLQRSILYCICTMDKICSTNKPLLSANGALMRRWIACSRKPVKNVLLLELTMAALSG
jgi:hypothetical protein